MLVPLNVIQLALILFTKMRKTSVQNMNLLADKEVSLIVKEISSKGCWQSNSLKFSSVGNSLHYALTKKTLHQQSVCSYKQGSVKLCLCSEQIACVKQNTSASFLSLFSLFARK